MIMKLRLHFIFVCSFPFVSCLSYCNGRNPPVYAISSSQDYNASPSFGDAYNNRQLTPNFELKFFVYRHVSMWGIWNGFSLSICLYPEKRNHPCFDNISPTLVIDTSMKRSLRALQHGNPKNWFFFSKNVEIEFRLVFWLVLKGWNHLSFVNISPTGSEW